MFRRFLPFCVALASFTLAIGMLFFIPQEAEATHFGAKARVRVGGIVTETYTIRIDSRWVSFFERYRRSRTALPQIPFSEIFRVGPDTTLSPREFFVILKEFGDLNHRGAEVCDGLPSMVDKESERFPDGSTFCPWRPVAVLSIIPCRDQACGLPPRVALPPPVTWVAPSTTPVATPTATPRPPIVCSQC